MDSPSRRRPSPALVISLIALFVALGGTGYAAIKLPANSVGSKQLKKKAVTKAKIAPQSVDGTKVKDGSLRAKDFAPQDLPKGQTGDAGRDGAAVAVRARSTGSVDTPGDHSDIAIPLTSNTWTQSPGELDFGPMGQITYKSPPSDSCNGAGFVQISLRIDVDGKTIFTTTPSTLHDGQVHTFEFSATRAVFEPDSAQARTANATVSSRCIDDVQDLNSFPAPVTVTDLRFDVIRAN